MVFCFGKVFEGPLYFKVNGKRVFLMKKLLFSKENVANNVDYLGRLDSDPFLLTMYDYFDS